MSAAIWFVQQGEKVLGPCTPTELKTAVTTGLVRPETRIRRDRDPQWYPAAQVSGLFDAAPAAGAGPVAPVKPTGPVPVGAAGLPGSPPAANPFMSAPAAAPPGAAPGGAMALGAGQQPVSAPASDGAGGSLLDLVNSNPALQFGAAAAVTGAVTFLVAMLFFSLTRGSADDAGPVTVANVADLDANPPAAPQPTPPVPAPIVPAPTAASTPSPAPATPAPTAPAATPMPALETPAAPSETPNNTNKPEMTAPADGEPSEPAEATPTPENEPSQNTPDGGKPRVSLAELVVPEAGTKQKESFEARVKRLGEIHRLHATSLNEWRGHEERRAPLQQKAEALIPAIQNAQRLVAEWQNELQICQGEYNGAVQRYNTASEAFARNAAQSDGNYWQGRANTAQNRLTQYSQQLVRQQQTLADTQKQLADVVGKQSKLIASVDDSAPEWMQLCDPFGKLSAAERAKVLGTLDQWIKDEPLLAYSFMGRAFVHVGNNDSQAAQLDLAEAERLDPRLVIATKPVRGYALARSGETKAGLALLNEITRDAPKAWLPFLLRGRVYLDTGEYGRAEGDFEKATRFGDNVAEAYESLAYLLSACPQQSILSGKKALAAATKACDLTKSQDWRCLDVLAAAHAESGDFETAEKHAKAAMELAASEFAPQIEERLKLYHQGQAYRFPVATGKRDR